MNHTEVPLCVTISSENVPTQKHEAHGAGDSIKPSKFVNHGLILWNKDRQKWKGDRKAVTRSKKFRVPKLRTLCRFVAKRFCCSGAATYDKLLRKNKPFPVESHCHNQHHLEGHQQISI